MNSETAKRILSLNYQFYQNFAEEFSETRQRLQPGVLRLIESFPPGSRVLDLGCGNGELARELVRIGFSGSYLGTDFSSHLLQKAQEGFSEDFPAEFTKLDLSESSWANFLPDSNYEIILSFAVLHHIPGHKNRLTLCRNIRRYISEGGAYYHSNWQFLRSERQKRRIIPWREAGFSENDLDEGDYLLDWKRGGKGTRYVHHFSQDELSHLADQASFEVVESFFSDGKEGDLSIYQIWKPI
ncbi:MAG: class I SAM-dependent methyltransferase [Anaerolineales bacterium]